MKFLFRLLLSAGILANVAACGTDTAPTISSSPVPAGASLQGVFEGITPCSALARPLPQIPADSDCEQMIWKMILYHDADSGAPTTYTLKSAYGVPKQGTLGLEAGGIPITMEGKWAILTGTKLDPDAVVYQLNPDTAQTAVSFLKLDEDILHVLSSDLTLLVGNAGWSYTLNRTDNREPGPVTAGQDPGEGVTRPPLPAIPAGSSVLGVFEGRTPCHEIVIKFTKLTPYPGCLKIKWKLTLYQDQSTGAPSSYLFQGTRTLREGTWTILQGTQSDPEVVVYQLQLDNDQPPVSFLKVDDNHLFMLDRDLNFLVGNALFSYTLSRTDLGN